MPDSGNMDVPGVHFISIIPTPPTADTEPGGEDAFGLFFLIHLFHIHSEVGTQGIAIVTP